MNEENFKKYLLLRENVLNYTCEDMNLEITDDNSVYIALFDIPVKSIVKGLESQSLALVFGLNTHIYAQNGSVLVNLEQDPDVMKAMQSLLISSHQVLNYMELTNNIDFYPSNYVRAYLKTKKGIYFKELHDKEKPEKFLLALMNNVLHQIGKSKNNSNK